MRRKRSFVGSLIPICFGSAASGGRKEPNGIPVRETVRTEEIGSGWKNAKPLADLKKEAKQWKRPRVRGRRKKKKKGKHPASYTKGWNQLPHGPERLAYLCKRAAGRPFPKAKRTRRRPRRALVAHAKCACCGQVRALVRHHITPLSQSGPDTSYNIVKICHECHCIIHPWLQNAAIEEEWKERQAGVDV